jgi:hypothetical protein
MRHFGTCNDACCFFHGSLRAGALLACHGTSGRHSFGDGQRRLHFVCVID